MDWMLKAIEDADPMLHHKCQPVAIATPIGTDRELWLGVLLEPVPGHPQETHCLHVKTPYKDAVFGLNIGDASIMAVFAQIIHGMPFNQRWLDLSEKRFKSLASKKE